MHEFNIRFWKKDMVASVEVDHDEISSPVLPRQGDLVNVGMSYHKVVVVAHFIRDQKLEDITVYVDPTPEELA